MHLKRSVLLWQYLPPTFSHFLFCWHCSCQHLVEEYCRAGYPTTLKVPSNLAQVNRIILPLGMIRMSFWKSFLVKAVRVGENLIRLKCILAMFVLRIVRRGWWKEWQSELGMPWDALPSPGCLCAAFIFWARKMKIHLRCKSWCKAMQGITGGHNSISSWCRQPGRKASAQLFLAKMQQLMW